MLVFGGVFFGGLKIMKNTLRVSHRTLQMEGFEMNLYLDVSKNRGTPKMDGL